MAVNASTSNASFPTHPPTITYTTYEHLHTCLTSAVGTYSITAYAIILIIFILPLCIFILYLGHQQWKQQSSISRVSDSDFFTYHMVIIEMINISGFILCCFSVFFGLKEMLTLGIYLLPVSFCGQLLFHMLTCVERYLAVVHPITYMGWKNAHGMRIRNTIIVIVWMFCFSGASLMTIVFRTFIFLVFFTFLPLALVVISYCSIFVLCVLIRPGPGEAVRERQRLDQTKLRAFYTIASILGALLMRFGGNIVICILFLCLELGKNEHCGLWLSNLITCLPCSLVLPLLFLHRAGKLSCFKRKKSGKTSD